MGAVSNDGMEIAGVFGFGDKGGYGVSPGARLFYFWGKSL